MRSSGEALAAPGAALAGAPRPAVGVDDNYILAAAGLLATRDPDAAPCGCCGGSCASLDDETE